MKTLDRQLRRLKLRDLQVLRELAASGSMARAADNLAVTQSAISKTVAELEEALGTPLVDRLPRGVELTGAGQLLAMRAQIVFDELREGLNAIEALNDPASGELRIGTTEAMSGTVAEAVADLVSAHPGVRIAVEVSDTAALVTALRMRTLDVAWTRWTPVLEGEDLRVDPLFAAPLQILAHRDHPKALARSHSEVIDQAWTLSPPSSFLGKLVAEKFAENNWKIPERPVITVSIAMRLSLLATCRFLTVLPVTMCAQPATRSWLVPLPIHMGPETGVISLLSLARRTESSTMRTFRKYAELVARRAESGASDRISSKRFKVAAISAPRRKKKQTSRA